MAPNLTLHFFPAHDINGSSILEITDEDTFFRGFKYRHDLFALGGWELTLAREVGFALFDSGAVQPDVLVRFLVHAWSDTVYYGGGFLDKRLQTLIHIEETGEEVFRFGGPGPKQYLDRSRLQPEQFTGSGWRIDLENGVFRWEETAPAGRVIHKLVQEDQASDAPALPGLTRLFSAQVDSGLNAWSAGDVADEGSFEIPIGQSLLMSLWDMEDLEDIYSDVDLGTVAAPKYEFGLWNTYGTDRSSSTFAASKVLLREGVNIANDALILETDAIRYASHVIVEGKDGVYVTVPRTAWDPGEYVKYAHLSYPRSSKTAVLQRAGLRWLRRQDNGTKQMEVDILPGFDDATGLYFPVPDGLWSGDTVTLDTAQDGSTHTPLDFNNEDQLLTGFELRMGTAGDTSSALKMARSWHAKLFLNHERGGFDKSPQQRSRSDAGPGCKCLKLCRPGVLVAPELVDADADAGIGPSFPRLTVEAGDYVIAVLHSDCSTQPNATALYGPDGETSAVTPMTKLGDIFSGTSMVATLFGIYDPAPTVTSSVIVLQQGSGATGCPGTKRFGYFGAVIRGYESDPSAGVTFDGEGGGPIGSPASFDIASSLGDLVVAALYIATNPSVGPTATGTGQVIVDSEGENDKAHGAISGQPGAAGTTTSSFTWTPSGAGNNKWGLSQIVLPGDYVAGDGHPDLVGEGSRASRCGHGHVLFAADDPTVNDDEDHGIIAGVLWLNTTTDDLFLLEDATSGAAVWTLVNAGETDHGGLTGLGDDDHIQYLNEARHDALDHEGLPGVGVVWHPVMAQDPSGAEPTRWWVVVDGDGTAVMAEAP